MSLLLGWTQITSKSLLKYKALPSYTTGLWWNPKVCFFNKLLGDSDADHPLKNNAPWQCLPKTCFSGILVFKKKKKKWLHSKRVWGRGGSGGVPWLSKLKKYWDALWWNCSALFNKVFCKLIQPQNLPPLAIPINISQDSENRMELGKHC